jgi:antitoxin HicB
VNDKFNGAIKMSKRIGSNFDDFLESEGILAEVESVAWKRVISFQIEQLMEEQKLSKTTMAERMHTSRAAIDRLLDSNNGSATLQTLEKAAIVLGKRLRIEFI